MVYAAIGGMQLQHWTGYFRVIVPTMRVLKDARHAQGCVHADTFKPGDVFFALSVWHTRDQMRAFGRTGLHGQLTRVAMERMKVFYNHSQGFAHVPTRDEVVAAWHQAIADCGGRATVGTYVVS